MAEENTDTTEQNASEEQTDEKETQQEEKDNSQQKTEHTDSEKRLYARLKEAEEKAAKATAEAKKAKEEAAKAKLPISDIDAILEVQSSTRDLDAEEVSELKLRASSLGVSLSEARKDKNYQVWQRAYRAEVEKQNALKPSSKQDEVEKPKSVFQKLEEARTQEEKEKILNEMGLNPLNPRRDYHTL